MKFRTAVVLVVWMLSVWRSHKTIIRLFSYPFLSPTTLCFLHRFLFHYLPRLLLPLLPVTLVQRPDPVTVRTGSDMLRARCGARCDILFWNSKWDSCHEKPSQWRQPRQVLSCDVLDVGSHMTTCLWKIWISQDDDIQNSITTTNKCEICRLVYTCDKMEKHIN
jgi:hypothetical protein